MSHRRRNGADYRTTGLETKRLSGAEKPQSRNDLRQSHHSRFTLRHHRDTINHHKLIMLYTIALILIVLWLLGLVTGYTMGAFIHVLLVVAIIMVLLRLISGRRV